jgi:hypothetical protein
MDLILLGPRRGGCQNSGMLDAPGLRRLNRPVPGQPPACRDETEGAHVKTSGRQGRATATSGEWSPPVTETYDGVRLNYFATWVC